MRARALAYIDRHLADPELGPDLLVRRFRVSRAHLYRVFSDLGGIAQVIKARRLDAAYAFLVDPRRPARPVSQIAADFGFRTTARFRHAFIARFGVAPEDASGGSRNAASPVDSDNILSTHFAAHSHRPGQA